MESSILVNVKVVWTGQNLTSDMALQLYSGSTVDIPRWGSHRTFTHQFTLCQKPSTINAVPAV